MCVTIIMKEEEANTFQGSKRNRREGRIEMM